MSMYGPHLYIALSGLIVCGTLTTQGCALRADPGLSNNALSGLKIVDGLRPTLLLLSTHNNPQPNPYWICSELLMSSSTGGVIRPNALPNVRTSSKKL